MGLIRENNEKVIEEKIKVGIKILGSQIQMNELAHSAYVFPYVSVRILGSEVDQ